MDRITVGVVGCGYWGPKLVRNFAENPGVDLRWVCDLDRRKAEAMKVRYPQVRATDDVGELLRDGDLQAVAFATPVSTHHRLGRETLLAGKHLMLEKPLTASVREAEDLVELAAARGLVLMVDHVFLYSPPVRKIKSLVDGGEIGGIQYFDSVRINLGLFQRDVNVIWDLAPHDFSIMDHLVSERPVRLSAFGASPAGSGREEIAYVAVRFPGQLIAHFHVNWMSPVKIRSIILGGTRKMVVFNDLEASNKVQIYDRGVEITNTESYYHLMLQYRMGDMHAPNIDNTEALSTMVAHFADCVRGKAEPLSGGESALRVVRLLEAADRSLRSGGAAVDV